MWKNESQRHALSKRGISTKIKNTPMYHGTTKGNFQYFIPKYSRNQQLGFGIHFTPDLELAKMYAYEEGTAKRGKEPCVYKVQLDIKNPLVANVIYDEGTKEFDLAVKLFGKKLPDSHHMFPHNPEKNNVRQVWLQSLIDSTSPERAERLIKEFGYDGVIYNAKVITHDQCSPGYCKLIKESESYIVFDSNQVKIVECLK